MFDSSMFDAAMFDDDGTLTAAGLHVAPDPTRSTIVETDGPDPLRSTIEESV